MHKSLKKFGIKSTQIHSLLSQTKRAKNLEKFKQKKASVLLTTDLASWGLDLQGVDLVIMYNLPLSKDDFIHRAGRAAWGQRTGETISFVTQYETKLVQNLEQNLSIKFEQKILENEDTILKQMSKIDQVKRKIKVKFLGSQNFDKFHKAKISKKKFQNFIKEKTQNNSQ